MRNLVASLFVFLLFPLPLYGQDRPPTIQVYFFYAGDSQASQAILQTYLPALQSSFPSLEVRTFDVGNPSHYEALAELEKKFNRRAESMPAVFIGEHLLSGEMEVMEKLNPLITEYHMKGGASLPPVRLSDSIPVPGPVSGDSRRIDLAYFYQKGCPQCDRANYLLKYLTKKHPNLNVKGIDLDTADGKRLNETLSNRLSLPETHRLIAPSLFIGDDYLLPESVTELNVEELVRKYEETGTKSLLELEAGEAGEAEKTIVERFRSLGIFAVLSAGLIEGLNPCAFATLVFFVSYLAMVGRKREEIFRVGICFSATSFLTHLLLGLGILSFIRYLPVLPLFSHIVYLVTFLLSLGLGALSLYDYLQLRRGNPSKMRLQVPDYLKRKIHRIIRERSGELEGSRANPFPRLIIASVLIAFFVTLMQSTCTSQVYLPTILFVTSVPSLRGSAFLYLTFYNIVYVVPLVAIFTAIYWGMSSDQLTFFLQRKASAIKLLTAVFFFALAGLLVIFL